MDVDFLAREKLIIIACNVFLRLMKCSLSVILYCDVSATVRIAVMKTNLLVIFRSYS